MNKKQIISAMLALAMLPIGGLGMGAKAAAETVVQLNPADASPFNNGEFQGWGTALCWWANRIGYSKKLTDAAAKAFFSEEGLSLDIARYNLGGGDDPTHTHVTRSDSKVPGIWNDFELSEDGKTATVTEYRMENDQNQLNIAQAALRENPNLYFEAFSNSAPYFMTVTGCTSGGGTVNADGTITSDASKNNLKDDMYDDFAKFIAEGTQLLRDNGINVLSYSPMNEPDGQNGSGFYWGAYSPKQEGCRFSPGEAQSKAIIETRKALDEKGLTDVLVAGMDETSLKHTVNNLGSLSDAAKAALGRIDTHTYSDRNYHARVKAKALELGKNLWQSEVDDGGDGAKLANMIIEDVNGMQPSAWVMWDIVDFHKDSKRFQYPEGSGTFPEANNSVTYQCVPSYNTKNQPDLWGVAMADHDKEELVLTKKYYYYGQFTRYINPGDTIIASSSNTLAAYNKKTGAIKIVAHNTSNSDAQYKFDLSAFKNVGDTVTEIRTDLSGSEKWAKIDGGAELNGKELNTTLKAHTLTTYMIENSGAYLTSYKAGADGISYSYSASADLEGADKYFAVYDGNGILKAVTVNKPSGTLSGDFTDCNAKLMVWDNMKPEPVRTIADTSMDYALITNSGTINRGDTVQLDFRTNMDGEVTWSIDNTEIASISDTGELTAKKAGAVNVTAKVGDYSVTKAFEIVVYINIVGAPGEMTVGESATLTANTNAEGSAVWSADNSNVAEISADGKLTAKAQGTVTVTVTVGTYTASKQIKVNLYTLSGTPSWSNASSAPADKDDYLKAADGDLNTYFDGVQNGYVRYDYGRPYAIESIKLAARSGHSARTKGAKIQGSNDGISWTDLYTITSEIPSSYTEVTASQLANNNAYRYFRYTNPSDMTNIAEFLITAVESDNVAAGEPSVRDIIEFTDRFEGTTNIFNAPAGNLSSDGNQVYTTNLARYGNVFVPVKDTATAQTETITLTEKDRFRFTYNMFSGWESSGRENSMSIKDADDNELIGYTITGGGYNLNEMRIGGVDVLADESNKPVIQCTANLTQGANGWDHASQKYANTMGFNKTVEIIIDGTGTVNISLNGGNGDLSYRGTIDTPISIKTLELTGSYNSARGRVVSYDNLDADVITYASALPTPEPTPEPTEAPVVPANGELINLNFDNSNLSSTSAYGKAEGTPKFTEVDGKKCIELDGTAATAVKLTDANGNALLTGQDEITVSFKVKPATQTAPSWWLYGAPNDTTQVYQQEHYIGCLTNGGTMTVERYNNSGSRLPVVTGAYNANAWNDVTIVFANDATTLYINGVKTEQTERIQKLSDILGKSSVLYIGRANWSPVEYAKGYIDDFVIKKGVAASSN